MGDKIHRALQWLVSVLSEADGTGSSSRIAMMLVICAVAFSLVFFVVITKPHRFPDGNVILGLSALVTAAASIYGANAWKNKPSDAAQVVTATTETTADPATTTETVTAPIAPPAEKED